MKPVLTQHQFKAEWINDEHGEAVMVSQTDGWADEAPSVILHPWQLRAICEHFEILAKDEGASRQIVALKRQMTVLRDRLLDLHGHMLESPGHKRAEMATELTSVTALLDLAAEWCADFHVEGEALGGSAESVLPNPAKAGAPKAEQAELL